MREALRGALLSALLFGAGGLLAAPVLGQGGGEGTIDCEDPENAESELCGEGETITVTAPPPDDCDYFPGCDPPPLPPPPPPPPPDPDPCPFGCDPPPSGDPPPDDESDEEEPEEPPQWPPETPLEACKVAQQNFRDAGAALRDCEGVADCANALGNYLATLAAVALTCDM